jgi:hypothetical protein
MYLILGNERTTQLRKNLVKGAAHHLFHAMANFLHFSPIGEMIYMHAEISHFMLTSSH